MENRVVVTGLGIISPLGLNAVECWNRCLAGRQNIFPIPGKWCDYSNYKSRYWSPLPEINYENFLVSKNEQRRLDPAAMLTFGAVQEALANAQINLELISKKENNYRLLNIDEESTGVFIGTGIGGIHSSFINHAYQLLQVQKDKLLDLNEHLQAQGSPGAGTAGITDAIRQITGKMDIPLRFNPFAVSMLMPNSCAANINIKFGLKGASRTFTSACAAGTIAIGHAYQAIKNGEIKMAVAGGVEYLDDPCGTIFKGFDILEALTNGDNIETTFCPFDIARNGFLFSQGGCGILILETAACAAERGVPVLAEVTGFGETCDGHSIMIIDAAGTQIKRMMALALQEAGIPAEKIDYINAHGTGTQLNDKIEAVMINEIFGSRPFVNTTKSIMGHTIGASGAIEAAVTVLSVREQTLHACANLKQPLMDLNFVREAGHYKIANAISQSFGFGGHNACLVFRKPD